MAVNRNEIAVEELKLVQTIIQHQGDVGLRIKSWCITLVAVLGAARLNTDTSISASAFVLGATSLIAVFLWLDAMHRVPQDRAILRSEEIERYLREEDGPYDGPAIGRSLQLANSPTAQLKAANNVRVWGPYAALFAVVVVVGVAS